MSFAAVNGIKLYYERHGDSGEPLVFVHGYTGDVTDWRPQTGEFAPDYQILIMDLRGHGRSEAPPDRQSYTVALMTADVEKLTDHVGFGRYHLVGHSMGGGVAQEIALDQPEKLLSLTLEDTAPKFELPANDAMFEFRAKRMQLAQTEGMAAAATLELPWTPPHMPPERLQEVNERLARMSADAFIGAAQGLIDWQGTAGRLASILTPTLVIYGDLDAPALVNASSLLAERIPNASLEVVPETAHSPQWERPDLFNRALRRHLEANRSKS
ncbi:MAG TPA: alpha/beta hydrolase [Dehalococcoidia bacterium]|nr:alpha/beta hydrolase [Dehalococcoidia bacterium]